MNSYFLIDKETSKDKTLKKPFSQNPKTSRKLDLQNVTWQSTVWNSQNQNWNNLGVEIFEKCKQPKTEKMEIRWTRNVRDKTKAW